MKRLLIIFAFCIASVFGGFTELYVDTATGNNLYGGAPIGGAYPLSYAGGTFVRATGVFTVASGNPSSDGVTVGDFASVYTTAGATVATFVGRVTARDATTITVSTTAISGATASVSEAAAASTCVVGGAWKGPNAGVGFPFNFLAATQTNSAGDPPRANIKAGTYSITGAITHSLNGPTVFQGYTTNPGDGGRATIDGGTSTIVLLTISGSNNTIDSLIFQNNGTTGTNAGVVFSAAENAAFRCVFNTLRGNGLHVNTSRSIVSECEAYACGANNSAGMAGFLLGSDGNFICRSIAHDNTGSNVVGILLAGSSTAISCIADTNGGDGFAVSATTAGAIKNCDSYSNGGDGIDLTGASATAIYIENCNLIKNTGWGIQSSGSAARNGFIINCGFGAGTQANSSGTINTNASQLLSILTDVGSGSANGVYASNVTPWNDPANGDFRITLAAAKAAGRGAFVETASSYTGTIGYPSIGAAQPSAANSAAQASYGSSN